VNTSFFFFRRLRREKFDANLGTPHPTRDCWPSPPPPLLLLLLLLLLELVCAAS
jgi:hypothetical protein